MITKYDFKTKMHSANVNGVIVEADTEKELKQKIHDLRMIVDEKYARIYKDEMAKPLNIVTVTTDEWAIGSVSLVGVGKCDFPLSFGNYFSMYLDKTEPDNDMGVINIWYENLAEAIKRFDITELTFHVINGKALIVESDKIPSDWYIEDFFIEYNCSLNQVEALKVREYYKKS